MVGTKQASDRLHDRLKRAFDDALRDFAIMTDSALDPAPVLQIVDDDAFAALVEHDHNQSVIRITTGTVAEIEKVWTRALTDPELLAGPGESTARTFDTLVHHSLVWLVLHELMHLHLDHFALTGSGVFAETTPARAFAVASMTHSTPSLAERLNERDGSAIDHCLELQADHEAIDIFLGPYSEDRWADIRMRAAAVLVNMVLIEQAELLHGSTSSETHPSAAARFFLLIGHLFQMWIYPHATLTEGDVGLTLDTGGQMTPDMFEPFARAVVAPAINDAIILAGAGGAARFINQMGGTAPFLQDVFTVQWGDDLKEDDLQTEGAKQWFRLTPINLKIRALTEPTDEP